MASPTLSAVSEHEGSKRSNDSVLVRLIHPAFYTMLLNIIGISMVHFTQIAIEKLGEPRPTVLRDYAPAILKVPTSFTGARRRTMVCNWLCGYIICHITKHALTTSSGFTLDTTID